MHDRGFHQAPQLPQIPEDEEVRASAQRGDDLFSGSALRDALAGAAYDVEGIMLPRPFKIIKCGPISLFVNDIDTAARFYTHQLGLRVSEETVWNGHRCVFLRANTEHHTIALYPIEVRAILGLRPDSTTHGGRASKSARTGSCATRARSSPNAGAGFVELPSRAASGHRLRISRARSRRASGAALLLDGADRLGRPPAPGRAAPERQRRRRGPQALRRTLRRLRRGDAARPTRIARAASPPLAGLRVLELGSTVAGPSAGRLLADLGADVYKIEPAGGDQLRTWGVISPDGTGWWFKSHNRNKRLLTFDLRDPDDVAIGHGDGAGVRRRARELPARLSRAFRARRGDACGRKKPELIYLSISGYGQSGPYADRPGYGSIAEAMGGLRYITGESDGPPMRVGISLGDEIAALYAVIGVLAALRGRDRDAVGETIDVSLIESSFSLLAGRAAGIRARRRRGAPYRQPLNSAAPSNVYPTRDGEWLAIGGNGQGIFRRLAAAMGHPELADDERFATQPRPPSARRDARRASSASGRRRSTWPRPTRSWRQAGVPAGPGDVGRADRRQPAVQGARGGASMRATTTARRSRRTPRRCVSPNAR